MRPVLLSALIAFAVAMPAQAAPLILLAGPHAVPVAAPDGYSQVRVTIVAPDGSVSERRFAAGSGAQLNLGLAATGDGRYTYRLDFDGAATGTRTSAASPEGRSVSAGRAWPTIAGSFALVGGRLVTPDTATLEPRAKDQVIPDDLIVQSSLCVGLDCLDGEVFGVATIKMRENNLRILFDDTSTGVGFAANDWQLLANEQPSGGANRFMLEDITGARIPFVVTAGAPNDALFVASNGRIGLRTATPLLDLHFNTGDTPAIRLEQNASSGFTAQTWDVAGNEANFFVRDSTGGGSSLPFRIRPGAPTSSLDITASGSVGIGTASPHAQLDVTTAVEPSATPVMMLRVSNAGAPEAVRDRFTVDSAGNVTARGTIAQLSSRATKDSFRTSDGRVLLAKLETLPVDSWKYRDAPESERHIGPVAEDFHAAYGVGGNPKYLAPADVAGVALASVKALQAEVKARDARIEQLESRLAALEALLAEPR